MPKGIYPRTEPKGFLHPQCEHVVSVESIGEVYRGRNARDAKFAVHRWTKFSQHPLGRASGKEIAHTIDGEIQTNL